MSILLGYAVMVVAVDLQHLGVPEAIAAYLLDLGDGRIAVMDPGPASTLATLRAGVLKAGYTMNDVHAIFVTHVHLDHAGAAGALALETGAIVYAHPRAAPHLLDPARLWASATRVYGNAMTTLWGSMTPVPAAQLRVLEDYERVTLGGVCITAIDAPGHARHQHAFFADNGALFPGDAAAIRLPGMDTLMPATAPPEIDLEAWPRTLDRFDALPIVQLCLPHFGVKLDVALHFQRLRDALPRWAAVVASGLAVGEDTDTLAARLESHLREEMLSEGVAGVRADRAIRAAGPSMCVVGLQRALRGNG